MRIKLLIIFVFLPALLSQALAQSNTSADLFAEVEKAVHKLQENNVTEILCFSKGNTAVIFCNRLDKTLARKVVMKNSRIKSRKLMFRKNCINDFRIIINNLGTIDFEKYDCIEVNSFQAFDLQAYAENYHFSGSLSSNCKFKSGDQFRRNIWNIYNKLF